MSHGQHILLVEDSPTQALQMSHVLEAEGWAVTVADSAAAAMEALDRGTPDLILIDYYLPGVRGDTLCRQVRMRIDTRVVPIVILTGESGQQAELSGLDSGADDFIAKSADHHVLLVRLRALLTRTAPSDAPAPSSDADLSHARLLAVDDSRTYLAFLTAQLQAESYTVETTTDGREALERLRREDFDCVLVDLVMPGMNGIEVCSQINAIRHELGRSAMVLMLTGKEDNQSLALSLESGADDFVGKSSDIIVIKGRIRALLRRRFYEQEHRRRLSAELRAREMEAEHARAQQEAAEARSALVDDLERTTDALLRSNEELKQFADIASHDLQTPLRTISGFVQLLQKHYHGRLDAQADEWITRTAQSAERMHRLIQGLLDYSRMERQTDARPLQPVDMAEACRAALADLDALVRESGAQVTCGDLPTVTGDPTQLVELLENLIGNGLKYRRDEPPHINVSATRQDDEWVFSVRDNGIGIDPRHHKRIFGIFRRLHTERQFPGTGIGLAICRRVVLRHGGRIWIESTPGEGSNFLFTIPSPKGSDHERHAA